MSVLPELIQHDANDQTLNKYLLPLLEESEQRKAQVSAFEELKAQLGSENCFAQTTELLIQMAQVHLVSLRRTQYLSTVQSGNSPTYQS
jgi:lipid A disaccharide synthetase